MLYSILHGPEFWLALAIFDSGAIAGLLLGLLFWIVGKGRDNDK